MRSDYKNFLEGKAIVAKERGISMNTTTCPKCGGPAVWHTDDGVTYCNDPKCGFQGCENLNYRPPARRGGE